MCQSVCSDTLPRFRATSCLQELGTPCPWVSDLLPSSELRPPAFASSRHPASPFRRPVASRPHEKPKGEHYP